jgi:hypothetical protein
VGEARHCTVERAAGFLPFADRFLVLFGLLSRAGPCRIEAFMAGPAFTRLYPPFAERILAIHLWPVEPTRAPENICLYEVETTIDGQRYSVRSRRGAPFALARMLMAAGIADQPASVTHEGLRSSLTYRSLHWMAERTIGPPVAWPGHPHPEGDGCPRRHQKCHHI